MSLEAERVKIETHFRDEWALGPYASVPVEYDNIALKQSSGDFIKHRIVDSDGIQREIVGQGPTLFRYIGLVQVDIFVLPGSGSSTGRKIADTVSDIYRRTQLVDAAGGVITFRAPSFRALGTLGERFRFAVTCPFTRDIRH